MTLSTRRDPRRGSFLLASMIVITILSFVCAGILSYSLNTYRNSMRQAILDQAREVADSEMEYLYYAWKAQILKKTTSIAGISVINETTGAANSPTSPLVNSGICTTDMTVSSPAFDFNMNAKGWRVARQVNFNPIAGSADGSAEGLQPGTQQTGHNYYFTAYTSASINNAVVGTISFHSGRHFVYSSTSLFQYAVFYQGILEFAPGGTMTVQGPISTNASAYIGSNAGTLTLADKVYYFQDYNGASDPLTGETLRLQGTASLTDPVYNPDPTSSAPADQAGQRAQQVIKLGSQSSFIGGVDVQNDITEYVAAYPSYPGQTSGTGDPNEVYRSVIAPPPVDATGNLIPEDPVVQSNRMYNTAGIIITVETQAQATAEGATGMPVPSTNNVVLIGNATNPDAYTQYFTQSQVLTGPNPILPNVRQNAKDQREYLNGSTGGVNMTTLDVENLNSVLQGSSGLLTSNTTLGAAYNGVVYVYDKTPNDGSSGPANSLNGILINHAAVTPDVRDANGNPLGFTIVSDNGVYVQGDYNTQTITVGSNTIDNPSAIMGDAVTALSQAWTPAKSLLTITGNSVTGAGNGREAGASQNTPASGVNPEVDAKIPNGMQINAAILTGNTPTTTSYNSGGAQNLVRMLEDWYYPGLTLELNGSLGQLFTSKYFSGPYLGNSNQAGLGGDKIYYQPVRRVYNYDSNTFQNYSAAGSPTTTNFARGDFFFW